MKTLRSSFLACGLIFSLAPTITAADQRAATPSDRVDGRYWTEVRPERLVTPCTPFAKDYPRPPRVLFLVPGTLGPREVSELDQRFNMEFDVILYHGPWTIDALGQSNMYTAAIAGVTQEEQLARLLKLLAEHTYDAIVFGHNVSFDGLSPRAKYEVLKQVAGGTGLVLLKPFPQTEWPGKFPAQFANGPQPLTQADILAGVPLEMIPIQAGLIGAGSDLSRITRATMAGKGRVVWLNSAGSDDGNVNIGTHALTPYMPYRLEEDVLYDQSLSAVAKAILAAIPTKGSPVIPDVANARVMDVPFASVPGAVTIGAFACPLPLTVQMSVVNLLGDRIALPPVSLPAGGGRVSCTLPALPAGQHFIEYRLVSKAGTEWWGSLGLRVQAGAAGFAPPIGEPKPAQLERVAKGLMIDVNLTGQTTGTELRYRGNDLNGREIFRGHTAGADHVQVTAPLNLAVTIPHTLRLELWQGQRCLALAQQQFFVQQPMPTFINLVFGGSSTTILSKIKGVQLRKTGFNTFMTGGNASNGVLQARDNAHCMDMCLRLGVLPPPEDNPTQSFADPEYLKTRLSEPNGGPAKAAGPYKDFINIYNLGDENGYSYSRPRTAPAEATAFRDLVRATYGNDLALLNAEWQTKLTSFDEIAIPDVDKPMPLAETPHKHLWMHFVEKLYADIHHAAAAAIRANDPDPAKFIGAEGSNMGDPELTLPGLTMWGPYPSRLDNALMRSFGSPDLLRGNWWGGYLAQRAAGGQPLWTQLLSGAVNSSFYFQDLGGEGALSSDLSFTDFFEKEQWPVMREVNAGVGPLLARMPTANLGLGIYYSRVSEHALTIDGRTGSAGSTRDGLLAWSEDLGIPAFFHSAKQIEAGRLELDGIRILFMPQAICLDEATVTKLDTWVKAGGVLVADMQPGFRNERAAARATGVADSLFGVKQTLDSVPRLSGVPLVPGLTLDGMLVDPGVTATTATAQGTAADGTPILFARNLGKGRTLLLNFSLGKALAGAAENPHLRGFLRGLLDQAGVDTAMQVPIGLRVHRFACGDVQLLGCQQNVPEQANQPLLFGKKRFVYDVRHGRDLGEIDRLVPTEHGGRNSLFTVSDRPLAGFSATLQGKSARGSMIELVLSPTAKAGDLINRCLYRVAVVRPDGIEDENLRRFVWAEGKPITVPVPMAWNVAAGNWRLVATDLLTGRQQTVTYNLEAQP